jgi:hypothetical protein
MGDGRGHPWKVLWGQDWHLACPVCLLARLVVIASVPVATGLSEHMASCMTES